MNDEPAKVKVNEIRSRAEKWIPLTVSDLKNLCRFNWKPTIVWKPTYEHYYTLNAIFSTLMIAKIFLYDGLTLIEKYLHLVVNNSLGNDYKKTAKIQSIHY